MAFGTYGLLHLPKMPELRGQDTSSFVPSPISIEDIPYKDKSQQKQAEVLKAKKGVGRIYYTYLIKLLNY